MPEPKGQKKVIAKNSTVMVRRTITKVGSEPTTTADEDIISVYKFVTEPAEVEVSIGLTMNTSKYDFAKMQVSVRIPCYKEEIGEAYTYAQKFVEEKIVEEKKLIDKYCKGKQQRALF